MLIKQTKKRTATERNRSSFMFSLAYCWTFVLLWFTSATGLRPPLLQSAAESSGSHPAFFPFPSRCLQIRGQSGFRWCWPSFDVIDARRKPAGNSALTPQASVNVAGRNVFLLTQRLDHLRGVENMMQCCRLFWGTFKVTAESFTHLLLPIYIGIPFLHHALGTQS